jgi:hypothetical protein
LATLNNLNLLSRDELPQTHEAVDRGIHREKVGSDLSRDDAGDARFSIPTLEYSRAHKGA